MLIIYTVIVYNCYMNTLISTYIFKCGGVLAFILLTVYSNTHNYFIQRSTLTRTYLLYLC